VNGGHLRWLRWLLLAAVASCLNPKPDDEPLARPGLDVPGTTGPDSAGAGADNGPPILSGDAPDEEQVDPGSVPADSAADAGVPPGDAGVSSGDAGPSPIR
jgi:hypothetical protein